MPTAFNGLQREKEAVLAAFDAEIAQSPRAIPVLARFLAAAPDDEIPRTTPGFPVAMVRLLDRLLAVVANSDPRGRGAARYCARRCLDDVRADANLGDLPGRIMCLMLRHVDARAEPKATAPEISDLIQRVIDLHERAARGLSVDPSEWGKLRGDAMVLTDSAGTRVLTYAAQAAEAAAWDIATSTGVLVDVLGPYSALSRHKAALDSGWTESDERRSTDKLQAIYNDTAARRDAGEDVSIPGIFRALEPDLSKRFEQSQKVSAAGDYKGCLSLLDDILAMLADAPVAADFASA